MRFDRQFLKPAVILFIVAIPIAVYLTTGTARRTWAAEEVPLFFWAWRTSMPTASDLRDVQERSGAGALFLRAGQFDIKDRTAVWIRPANGQIPRGVDLHLVYNATPELLNNLDSFEPEKLAGSVAETYGTDVEKYVSSGAKIVGLQLDLDYPTRLLPRYAEMVRSLRSRLGSKSIVSVTGLPTWMNRAELKLVLDQVDFWIPQLYGAEIPTSMDKAGPISSGSDTRRALTGIRNLGKPFIAGLAAYGYTIQYGRTGQLLDLRGDIDLSSAMANHSLELVRREDLGGETKYLFRAIGSTVLDGLVIGQNENLVFYMPSFTELRDIARIVRMEAGDELRGICIFRLPTADDKTNLRLSEIVDAVRDRPLTNSVGVTGERLSEEHVRIAAVNSGSVSSQTQDALTIDLHVPPGSVRGISAIDGFTAVETLCAVGAGSTHKCSTARANIIRLSKTSWRPGDGSSITFISNWKLNEVLTAIVATRNENGSVENTQKQVQILGETEEKKCLAP